MKDGQNKLNMRADKATKTGAETAMGVLQKAASLRDKDRYRDRDSQAHREDFHIRRQTQTEGRRQPGGAQIIPPHREKETGTETTGEREDFLIGARGCISFTVFAPPPVRRFFFHFLICIFKRALSRCVALMPERVSLIAFSVACLFACSLFCYRPPDPGHSHAYNIIWT